MAVSAQQAARAELARRELARRASMKEAQLPEWQQNTRAGFKRIAGFPEVLLSMGSSAVASPVAGIAGIGGALLPGPQGQGANFTNKTLDALTYSPRSESGQQAAATIAKPFEAIERFADRAGEVTGDPSDTMGATLVKTALLGAPAVLGMRGLRQRPASPVARPVSPPRTPPPSIDDLRQAASAAYTKAENSGVFIKNEAYSKFLKDLEGTLAREGIDKGLHPKAIRAMKRAKEDAGRNLTLKGAETIRRNISDAASSIDKADQRMALIMRDKLDDFMENLQRTDLIGDGDSIGAISSLSQARGLWSRVRKAEEIEKLIDRAKLSAPNFSASGFENALRTEFRSLAKNDKRMRRYTKVEQAAIRRVAEGGPVENLLRMIGKAAPTGIVSGALGSGAGMAFGGPVGAVGVPLLGLAGRGGATALTRRNVSRVEEMVRRGQPE